jgi:hypothetical protein
VPLGLCALQDTPRWNTILGDASSMTKKCWRLFCAAFVICWRQGRPYVASACGCVCISLCRGCRSLRKVCSHLVVGTWPRLSSVHGQDSVCHAAATGSYAMSIANPSQYTSQIEAGWVLLLIAQLLLGVFLSFLRSCKQCTCPCKCA